jgi:hypothetical protein
LMVADASLGGHWWSPMHRWKTGRQWAGERDSVSSGIIKVGQNFWAEEKILGFWHSGN